MKLKVKVLGIDSGGKPIVFLNRYDAEELGITALGRIRLKSKKNIIAIVNLSQTMKKGYVGINEEVRKHLKLKTEMDVDVDISTFPKSLQYIRHKLNGKKLLPKEIQEIIKGVVEGNLTESEISAFVTTLHTQGLDLDEINWLSLAMVNTGKKLHLKKKIIVDKHSIGGVPGDKTSLLVVPIIASAGLTIPKTSSRAITSAAGTADRAEVLMPVNLNIKELQRVVKKCNGCISWGGSLELAPADDIFVKTEYSLFIDPLLMPSIMSKKKAVGATHLIVDIPTGIGTKMQTIEDADHLAKNLIELGRRLNIHTHCILTHGEQPIGLTIGPALEAKEALEVLMNKSNVSDLIEKACNIAGAVFELSGKQNGYALAKKILESGKAEKKLREIIHNQGGDSNIRPNEIKIGKFYHYVKSKKNGYILRINNNEIVEIARTLGSPKDHGAGILLNKKQGDTVLKNEILFTLFSENPTKLSRAKTVLKTQNPISVGKKIDVVIHKVKESPLLEETFIIDR